MKGRVRTLSNFPKAEKNRPKKLSFKKMYEIFTKTIDLNNIDESCKEFQALLAKNGWSEEEFDKEIMCKGNGTVEEVIEE